MVRKFWRICEEKHSTVIGLQELSFPLRQILLIFAGGRCDRYYWDMWLKIYRLRLIKILISSFWTVRFLLTKFFKSELFSRLQIFDHVTNYCKKKTLFASFLISDKKRLIFKRFLSNHAWTLLFEQNKLETFRFEDEDEIWLFWFWLFAYSTV